MKFEKGLIKAYKFFSENQNESVDDIQKYVNVDKDVIRQSTWNNYFYASPDPNKNGVVGVLSDDEGQRVHRYGCQD